MNPFALAQSQLLGQQIVSDCGRYDQIAIQAQLAKKLRDKAMAHLGTGKGVVAEGFRGEYLASTDMPQPTYQAFLANQSRNGVWATYIEAMALGELMGCHVVVTPVKNGVEQQPICLYRAQDDSAEMVHLYNSNNNHWFVNEQTIGDGNCLYNAFAQAIHAKVTPAAVVTPTEPSKVNPKLIEISQRAIEQSIGIQSKPELIKATALAERDRISQLPEEEQAQILSDYEFALSIANEDMSYQRHNLFSMKTGVPLATDSSESIMDDDESVSSFRP